MQNEVPSSGILHWLLPAQLYKKMTEYILQSSCILRKPQKLEEIFKLIFNLLNKVKKNLGDFVIFLPFSGYMNFSMIIEKESLKRTDRHTKIRMLHQKSII